MNLNFSNIIEEKFIKKVFNAYTLYIVLGIIVFANVFLFPDLLNHSDIKLNDLSYLMNKHIDVTTIDKIEDSTEVENVVNNVEQEKPKDDAVISETINTSDNVAVNNQEETIKADIDSTQVNSEQDVVNVNPSEAKETLTILDDSSKINIDAADVASVREEASLEDNNKNEVIIAEDKMTEEIDSNTDQSVPATIDSNTNEGDGVVSNGNVADDKNSEKIINDKTEDQEAFLKNENLEINVDTPSEDAMKNKRKLADFYYIILLFVLLSSFMLGFVMFIHKNYDLIKQTYNSTKSAYRIREYLYNGYELLED